MNVFGKVKVPSVTGKRCMITFINNFSRYTWVYFMKEKLEVFEKFHEFSAEVESFVRKKVCCIWSDNGGEYTSKEFKAYLKKAWDPKATYLSHYSTAEQNNWHIWEVCGCMMHSKNVLPWFWSKSMPTAAYLIYCPPQPRLSYSSPYEKLLGRKCSVKHLHVFRCVYYIFSQRGWVGEPWQKGSEVHLYGLWQPY